VSQAPSYCACCRMLCASCFLGPVRVHWRAFRALDTRCILTYCYNGMHELLARPASLFFSFRRNSRKNAAHGLFQEPKFSQKYTGLAELYAFECVWVSVWVWVWGSTYGTFNVLCNKRRFGRADLHFPFYFVLGGRGSHGHSVENHLTGATGQSRDFLRCLGYLCTVQQRLNHLTGLWYNAPREACHSRPFMTCKWSTVTRPPWSVIVDISTHQRRRVLAFPTV
jgi:hypothetical protein